MVHKKLISVIENSLDELAKTWLEETKNSHHMPTYHKHKDAENFERGKAVFINLHKWLSAGAKSEEVEHYFENVGAQRLNEGFPLTEVQYAIYLSKKIFWSFVDWRDAITGTFETSSAKNIMSVMNDYFDLGNYFVTRGYFHEMLIKIDKATTISKEDVKKLLVTGALQDESFDDEEFIWRPV